MSALFDRTRLRGAPLLHVMAAHSPLSAMLVEEADFDGIWASGFELSALYGLPDVSLISMTQHLDMVRAMAAKVTIPIVADIDTGFGNAINVIHAVGEYERAGAAAVVIEDKSFPKVTSLIADGRQDLVRTEEFVGKLQAALATRKSGDFLIIARTEALIAGLGDAEALARAGAYAAAGAELVLVHSKQKTPDEIERFARSWKGAVPLVIIPTAYPELDGPRIEALGTIGMVIYGNHAIRASVTAMQNAFRQVREERGIKGLDTAIVGVEEVFRLQRMDQVKADELCFLR